MLCVCKPQFHWNLAICKQRDVFWFDSEAASVVLESSVHGHAQC